MHDSLERDRATTNDLLAAALQHAQDFLATLSERPAGHHQPEGAPALPSSDLPQTGGGAAAALREAITQIAPRIAATASPRYLGYVTGGVTPAALVGDWLASVYDQNPQGLKWFGDVSGRIEYETIGMLRQLFGLPDDFHGGLVTGATMSSFTCLGVARQWVGKQQGYDVAAEGLRQPVHVLSATPHASAVKALSMLGLGSRSVIRLATLPDREAMDVADLDRKAAALDGEPFIVIASAGTVNTVDFDDFTAIVALRKKYNFWLHIDAAFGGFAALTWSAADLRRKQRSSSRTQSGQVQSHLLMQWQAADSITIDNHKWLNVPYDSGTWFVRTEHQPLQHATYRNGNAAYLNLEANDYTYLNLGPENSRRLRALPVWFTLKAYGKDGYRDIVERCVATAKTLGEALIVNPHFVLLAPVHLNVVAFTVPTLDAAGIDALCQQLNDDGRYFFTPTTLNGQRGLRAAFVNWQHAPDQVPTILNALLHALQTITRTSPVPG